MYISENSIQLVRDSSITQVISNYLKLDRKGKACCPFHNEKSPSFQVTEAKGIYKCFGCGASGDAIRFVMEHEKYDFLQAVEAIAGISGLELEYEEVQDIEKYEKQKAWKDQLKEVLRFTVKKYRENIWELPEDHPVTAYLRKRQFTRNEVAEWQLGWSTAEWRHITPAVINNGWFEVAEKLGIVKRAKNSDTNYDGYRSRITIPITNQHGEYIGLGGRYFQIDPNDGKDIPKYINSPESDVYSKSAVLFGLNKAIKEIQRLRFAYIVEGYFDVISMHRYGEQNTVGTCGTALTSQQAMLLKRYTNHAVLLRDGDAAGIKAAQRDLPILLRVGFKVDIIVLPKDEDPDSFILKLDTYNSASQNQDVPWQQQDAIQWQINRWVHEAAGDDFELGLVKQNTLELLANISNENIRDTIFNTITKTYKWNKAELMKKFKKLVEDEDEALSLEDDTLAKLPKFMNKAEFMEHGYCTVKEGDHIGYWTAAAGGKVKITNFVITPLFHIYAGKESRHLIQINNGYKRAVLDIESNALVSVELLQKYVVSEGAFIIYGQKIQILNIATTLLNNFPLCYEVKFLGWQPEGFFSYVDKIFIPNRGLVELDQWGILKFNDENYLVPAASAAYKELQRSGDDPYESDRALKFIKTDLQFELWGGLMHRVYLEKGVVGIAYVFLTLFRDIIFSIDNNCPHLYGFGERSAGKSKWAESIAAFFFKDRTPFNLNSGTDFAFFSYMQRFKNCPAVLNEFDEKVIKPEWFQAVKGIFDGEGRQRGVAGSRNRTEIMKIHSTIVLIGQYLCTMDDNSIVSRSIIEGFNERELSDQDKQYYDVLKDHEDAGLSSLISEVLKYREEFKARYKDRFNEILMKWRMEMHNAAQNFNQRIMQNWCHLYASYDIMSKYLKLPLENDQFEFYCKDRALYWSGFIRSSDTLSEFWNTFSFLVDQGTIIEGWDFKIEAKAEIRIRKSREEEKLISFHQPTKLLFVRMNNVHKHYQEAYRKRTGKEGMSMENLDHYLNSRKYYVGPVRSSRFKRWIVKTEPGSPRYVNGQPAGTSYPEVIRQQEEVVTSCFVFEYDLLNLDLERTNPDLDPVINGNGSHISVIPPAGQNGYRPVTQDLPFPANSENS